VNPLRRVLEAVVEALVRRMMGQRASCFEAGVPSVTAVALAPMFTYRWLRSGEDSEPS